MQFKHVPFFLPFFFSMTSAVAAGCQQVCCNAVVPSINPQGNVGIGCHLGGIDCGFGGQVEACCVRLAPIGAVHGTGIGCL